MQNFKRKIFKALSIIVMIFIMIQIPLSLTLDSELFPKLSFQDLRDGTYGIKLEQNLKDNSYLAEISSKYYQSLISAFINRTSKTVIKGKKNFLFLRERTDEITEEKLQENIPKIITYISDFKEILKSHDIDFTLVIIPNRSRFYQKYAYKNKLVPPTRKRYFETISKKLMSNGIKTLELAPEFKQFKRSYSPNIFFKIDHHWTWEFVHSFSPKLIDLLELRMNIPKQTPKEIYSWEWEDKSNAHDKILRKLGYSDLFIPTQYRELQRVPKFNMDKNQQSFDATNKTMMLSTSYGRYGIVEFLSNQLGYQLPFYIGRGKGPTFAVSEFIHKVINGEQSKPRSVFWIIAEFEFSALAEAGISLPSKLNVNDLIERTFKIKPLSTFNLEDNQLNHRDGHMQFKIKPSKKPEKSAQLVLSVQTKSKKRKSTIQISDMKYDLLHDDTQQYFPLPNTNDLITIETPYIKKLKKGRSFQIKLYELNE